MPIAPIGSVGSALSTAATSPTASVSSVAGSPVAGTGGTDFAQALQNGLQQVQDLQTTSDQLAVKAATGDLTDVHDYTIAASEASVATQLTVAIRDKAVAAFNDIMRMQM